MFYQKNIFFGLLGAIIGIFLGTYFRSFSKTENLSKYGRILIKSPLKKIKLDSNETPMNSQRTLVFVGVITSKDFLKSRAKAVYETWGKLVPGRIAFFSSEGSSFDDIPVISLKGVDDRYPPQKKSFMMLHYMYEHYIDKFEWFLRADDDVFIKPDKLEKFLRRVDSSKAQFIGQSGNHEESNLLALKFDENYCMGGPGILMSRETLKRVGPHISTCVKNLYTNHTDVEIGRCVQKYAKVPCTWNYEMKTIFHHNSTSNRAYSGNLKTEEVRNAITLHPVKRTQFMYRLYAFYLGQSAQELRQQSLNLQREIALMKSLLEKPKSQKMLNRDVSLFSENDEILESPPFFSHETSERAEDLIEWDYFNKFGSYQSGTHQDPYPNHWIEISMKECLDDVINEIMEKLKKVARLRGREIEFKKISYAYSRVNSLHGHDLIFDLGLVYKKFRGSNRNVKVRKHLYVQRSFTETRIREIENKPKQVIQEKATRSFAENVKSIFFESYQEEPQNKIVFVLPLSGRYEIFLRFLNNFEDIVLRKNETAELLISSYINNKNPRENSVDRIINHLNLKYQKKSIKRIKLSGDFSRGVAIDKAIQSDNIKGNDIVFLIDVDVLFNEITLQRVRQNTIQSQQVYLPIVFSEYDPKLLKRVDPQMPLTNGDFLSDYENFTNYYEHYTKTTLINNERGYFRVYGFGLLSIFKSDLVSGFVTGIKGWGLEDVQFFEKLLKDSKRVHDDILSSIADEVKTKVNGSSLEMFRAPDESLVHIFHQIVCDKNVTNQYQMCLNCKAVHAGNYRLLKEKMFLENDFLKFVKSFKKMKSKAKHSH